MAVEKNVVLSLLCHANLKAEKVPNKSQQLDAKSHLVNLARTCAAIRTESSAKGLIVLFAVQSNMDAVHHHKTFLPVVVADNAIPSVTYTWRYCTRKPLRKNLGPSNIYRVASDFGPS